MYTLKSRGLKLLKVLHLITASCWVGGALSLFFLFFLKGDIDSQEIIHGVNQSIHHVDFWVIILPGAPGCALTGLAYSLFTNWGFVKHRWVAVKWVITIIAILSGTFFLGPWEKTLLQLSANGNIDIFNHVPYGETELWHFILGSLQVAMLLFTVVISVYKPWRKKSSA